VFVAALIEAVRRFIFFSPPTPLLDYLGVTFTLAFNWHHINARPFFDGDLFFLVVFY